ncbi:hypothetical protein FRC98_09440 [Lujinxingia vulgaris]|uniref:Uncharacterized protein n=1 Tax=Lujinxingia vulgaris TaxID=2600176 RepID=A0A5C6X6R6_9DELT|nr:hypothetical protein [Lujinxingia vulgaris]TXD36954.1 hypothetical protein FRC98_09440 [Lujinxingia vulgaris]
MRFTLIAVLLLLGCEPESPPSPSSARPAAPSGSELARPPEAKADTPPAPAAAALRATPDANLKVGDTVEVCWQAPDRTGCTLSILHASGEGDFGEVPASGCRELIVEHTTLIELFCQGDTHALLQLDAAE